MISYDKYDEIRLTSTNTSESMVHSAGTVAIGGTFGTGAVNYNLTGAGATLDTGIVAEESFYSNASYLTFNVATPDGTTDIWVRWYHDSQNGEDQSTQKKQVRVV